MTKKQRGGLLFSILLIGTLLLPACTQSLSEAPAATPTVIPTGLFVSPIASVENPMAMIEEFAKQTAAAQTATAGGGTPVTPQEVVSGTPGTPGTPQIEISTATPTLVGGTPTNVGITPVTTLQPGSSYTLQTEEFPYCIARRYNVNPSDLLKASGLTSPDIYYAGLKLTIPQNSVWPVDTLGPRSLINPRPASYTVTGNGDTTVNGVACKFGDLDPASLLSINGLSANAVLTIGQTLKIP